MDAPRGPGVLGEEAGRAVGVQGGGNVEVTIDERLHASLAPTRKRQVREAALKLKERPFLGDRVQRDRWPKSMKGFANLFRLGLPDGWRLLYTVASSPTFGRELRIVWMGDHKAYDRLVGYR